MFLLLVSSVSYCVFLYKHTLSLSACDSMFSSVGSGATEVHVKVGASTAFVILADGADLAASIRAFDWAEYGGKKLRVSKSNKKTF